MESQWPGEESQWSGQEGAWLVGRSQSWVTTVMDQWLLKKWKFGERVWSGQQETELNVGDLWAWGKVRVCWPCPPGVWKAEVRTVMWEGLGTVIWEGLGMTHQWSDGSASYLEKASSVLVGVGLKGRKQGEVGVDPRVWGQGVVGVGLRGRKQGEVGVGPRVWGQGEVGVGPCPQGLLLWEEVAGLPRLHQNPTSYHYPLLMAFWA